MGRGQALEVHQHEAPVADALAGLLAALPLEEDDGWAQAGRGLFGRASISPPLAPCPHLCSFAARTCTPTREALPPGGHAHPSLACWLPPLSFRHLASCP